MAHSSLAVDADREALPARIADRWGDLVSVPVTLSVEVAFEKLSVRDLCNLRKGLVLATAHAAGAPVPVSVAGVLVGWAEFQVVGDKLALRIAEME
jgi:flagellar motor switch/type III secretory pathway protein FliN